VILIFEHDLSSVNGNQRARYLGQESCSS